MKRFQSAIFTAQKKEKCSIPQPNKVPILQRTAILDPDAIDIGAVHAVEIEQIKSIIADVGQNGMATREHRIVEGQCGIPASSDAPGHLWLKQCGGVSIL